MFSSGSASVHGLPAPGPRRTPYDSIFRVICLAHGLDVEIVHTCFSKMMQRMFLVLRSVMFACSMLVYYVHNTASGREFSVAQITSDLGGFIFLGSGTYAAWIIGRNQKDIQGLLRANGRCFQHVVFPALCALPAIVASVEMSFLCCGWVPALNELLCMHAELTMISFFVIYTDVLMNLKRRNLKILASLRDGRDSECSIPAKWELRDAIARTNSICGTTLALFYVEFSMAAIYTFSRLVGSSHDIHVRILLLSNVFCIALQLLVLATRSSALVAISLQSEYYLSRRLRPDSSIELTLFKVRDEWDAPTVWCFSHSVRNFLKFLASAVTCIAVILQFDHRVVRRINSLGAS